MLSLDIFCFKNSVNWNHLASKKSADQDLQCFHSACKEELLAGMKQANLIQIRVECHK